MQTLNVFRMIKQTRNPIYILISLDHSIEQVGFRPLATVDIQQIFRILEKELFKGIFQNEISDG